MGFAEEKSWEKKYIYDRHVFLRGEEERGREGSTGGVLTVTVLIEGKRNTTLHHTIPHHTIQNNTTPHHTKHQIRNKVSKISSDVNKRKSDLTHIHGRQNKNTTIIPCLRVLHSAA